MQAKKRASTKKKKKTPQNDEDIMSEQSKVKSGRWTNAVQLALRRKKDKMQLGWHLLEDTNRCKVMTYAFIYYYDNLKNSINANQTNKVFKKYEKLISSYI